MSWMAGAGMLGGGLASAWAQERANRANKERSDKQMEFQERMSSTAVQRSADDMEKAGFNRILAAPNGPASSPGGAMPNIKSVAEGAGSSAQGVVRLAADLKKIKAATRLDEAALPGVEGNSAVAQVQGATAVRRLRAEVEMDKKYPGFMGKIDALMRRLGLGATNRGVSIRSGGRD